MAKGPPGAYTSFLLRFLDALSTLAQQRQPGLVHRFCGAGLLSSRYQVGLGHPTMSALRWSFRQNRLTRSQQSKTFNVEFTPRDYLALRPEAVEKAFRDSGLPGEFGYEGSEFFFQLPWGYGRQTDRLVQDAALVNQLRNWAVDAMALAISLVERDGAGAATGLPAALQELEPASSVSVAPGRYVPVEGLLEDLIVEQWPSLDFGADLEFVERQKRCGDIGIIDILARSRRTRAYVVIELKKCEADDEVFGQLARYMGWVKERIADPEGLGVEGLIIAYRITPKLRSAVASHPGVRILRYTVDGVGAAYEGGAGFGLRGDTEVVLRIRASVPRAHSAAKCHTAPSPLAVLPASSLARLCSCGEANPSEARFCRRCGQRIEESSKRDGMTTDGRTRFLTPAVGLVLCLLGALVVWYVLRALSGA